MPRLDREKHDEKKRQILGAAERCFKRDGFRGARTADICAEACISPGHLYHYFESKEAMIGAMADLALERAAGRFDAMTKKLDVVAALLAEIEYVGQKRRGRNSSLIIEIAAEASRNPAIAAVLQKRSGRLRELLADFLRIGQERGQVDPGLAPEPTAVILMDIIDGATTLSVRDPKLDMAQGTELLKIMVRRFLEPPGAPCVVPRNARTASSRERHLT